MQDITHICKYIHMMRVDGIAQSLVVAKDAAHALKHNYAKV